MDSGDTGQDNATYQARLASGIRDAVLEAGRARPGANETMVNLDRVLDGLCEAMATYASLEAQFLDDRDKLADAFEKRAESLASFLKGYAAGIRSGAISVPMSVDKRPQLRIVE